MSDPSVVRVEAIFRKGMDGTRYAIADLILIRQTGKSRSTHPLVMILDWDDVWKLDYGWECVLHTENFRERVL